MSILILFCAIVIFSCIITNKFSKESYVANLYQFNLIIQALNVNIDLLSSVMASNKQFNEKNAKKTNKKADNKKK